MPPVNEPGYPQIRIGGQNPDETFPVTITDRMYDPLGMIKKVVAKVDGDVEFAADNIAQSEYEFSFTVDLPVGGHTLTINARDYVDHHLNKEETFVVAPRAVGGTILPTDRLGLVIPWIVAGALILAAAVPLAIWNRERGAQRTSDL